MVRIWAKLYKDNKIIKDFVYESIDNLSSETFYLHLEALSHKMDIPTPVVLSYHIKSYKDFNRCLFSAADFVESIAFDKLEIENAL